MYTVRILQGGVRVHYTAPPCKLRHTYLSGVPGKGVGIYIREGCLYTIHHIYIHTRAYLTGREGGLSTQDALGRTALHLARGREVRYQDSYNNHRMFCTGSV